MAAARKRASRKAPADGGLLARVAAAAPPVTAPGYVSPPSDGALRLRVDGTALVILPGDPPFLYEEGESPLLARSCVEVGIDIDDPADEVTEAARELWDAVAHLPDDAMPADALKELRDLADVLGKKLDEYQNKSEIEVEILS